MQIGLIITFAIFCTKFVVCTLTVNGSIAIHSLIFNKIINTFEYVLVKFDEPFSYGDKEEVFKEISKVSIDVPNLITASVGVAEYGEKENYDIADRYNILKKDFPAYRLFNRDVNNPKIYSGDLQIDALKTFLVKETGIYLGLEGCIEKFDKLAKQFVQASGSDAQSAVLGEMRTAVEELRLSPEDTARVSSAEQYIKIAVRMMTGGKEFAVTESARLSKLVDGNISDNKKVEIKLRLNILQSFQPPTPSIDNKMEL